MNLRNAPASILIAAVLVAIGAIFNFVIGLLLSLAPQLLEGIEVPRTPSGAPTQLLLVTGIACIAFGFVFLWVIKELLNKSPFAIVMIYTISVINILFGLFRLPFGLLTISVNLIVVFMIRSNSARAWLNSN